MTYDIIKAVKGYNRFFNREFIQKDYDKINILELIARIQDNFTDKEVDFIASKIEKDGSIDEKFINIKNIFTDVLSNNLFYLEIKYNKLKFSQFKLSSLHKETDYENNIFIIEKNDLGDYINFDKSFLQLDFDVKFLIDKRIFKNDALEIYFNYMNWE